MASAIHRITRIFHKRVNTPDFPVSDYIINPNLSAVMGVPRIYRKITGDVVSEMSQEEKLVVDAIIDSERVDSEIAESNKGFNRRLILTIIDEVNSLGDIHDRPIRTMKQFRNRMRSK